jgi:transposase-like protein
MSELSAPKEEPDGTSKTPAPVAYQFPDGSERAIQVNFCKNPRCDNYGVPSTLKKHAHRAKSVAAPGTEYILSGTGRGTPRLGCRLCKEAPPIKSNQGIAAELNRLMGHLAPSAPICCPTPNCPNRVFAVSARSKHYYSNGKTEIGSPRYKCRACGKTFSTPTTSTSRQRVPHKNKKIFKLLMNKSPLSRICEVESVNIHTVYRRIDFIHKQCLAFVGHREQALLQGKPLTGRAQRTDKANRKTIVEVPITRLYLAVDRQSYPVNWSQRRDKRNVILQAIGSADLTSGYVFGMHLNFNGQLDPALIEWSANVGGDYQLPPPYREYAHLWLEPDYLKSVQETSERLSKRSKAVIHTLAADIAAGYADTEERTDVESPDMATVADKFPRQGMQVRTEYTMYAHFFMLRQMLRGVEKVRFYLDQESGIRAACLSAFESEIKGGNCEAFYVRINKEMMDDEKNKAIAQSRSIFMEMANKHPGLNDRDIAVLLMREEMVRAATVGKWSDRWLVHPMPNKSEPEKSICYLTDTGRYEENLDPDGNPNPNQKGNLNHLANLYLKGSLHGIDRFFMQVRRRLSLLERPIGTPSKMGRTWYGYSAYQPENVQKMLEIFRVYYNYCLVGQDRMTPAMRLGLAQAVTDPEDILYFM